MSDPASLVALGSSVPLVLKVLGPTADYIGGEVQQWTQLRVKNLREIVDVAARKLGSEGLERDGAVPPRVLKEILEEGSFSDDELRKEYFGGILALSKSSMHRDDRGATLAALVGRMSTYQVRSHYVMYEHARRLLAGTGLNVGLRRIREPHGEIFLPRSSWELGMGFDSEEAEAVDEIAQHCLVGLVREDLLGEYFGFGKPDELRAASGSRDFSANGFVFTITFLGMELFQQVHGLAGLPHEVFVSTAADFSAETPVAIAGEALKVIDIPEF